MSFYAKNFTYAGESSDMYNLEIASIDSGGAIASPGGGGIEIIDQFIYRRSVPFFYGIKYTEKLEFPVSFFSPDEITGDMASYINFWLFDRPNYEQLAIIQPDLDAYVFNCIFTAPEVIRVGNVIVGFNATAICDSKFAWEYPKTQIFNFSSDLSGSQIIFYNNSHNRSYLYPTMTFTMSSTGSYLSIVNTSDNNREFLFDGLDTGETMTINNDLGIIESSTNTPRLSKFNKNFLRFVPGINILTITGGISQLTLTYQFARRLGG